MRGARLGSKPYLRSSQAAASRQHRIAHGKGGSLPGDVLAVAKVRLDQPHPAARGGSGRPFHGPLHRHHRLCPRGKGRTGHDPRRRARANLHIAEFTSRHGDHHVELDGAVGGSGKIGSTDRKAVHHRTVPSGRVDIGTDRFGQHPTNRSSQQFTPGGKRRRRLLDQPPGFSEVDHGSPYVCVSWQTCRKDRIRS